MTNRQWLNNIALIDLLSFINGNLDSDERCIIQLLNDNYDYCPKEFAPVYERNYATSYPYKLIEPAKCYECICAWLNKERKTNEIIKSFEKVIRNDSTIL